MAKQIEVRCDADIASLIIESLEWFVQTHYPHGADECSTAAREALLELKRRFETELLARGVSRYSSRIRAFVCEAVRGWLGLQESRSGECFAHRCEVVVAVCRGLSDGAGYALAEQQDAAAPGPGIESGQAGG